MSAAFDALIIYKPKMYCKRSPSFDTAQLPILTISFRPSLGVCRGKSQFAFCFSLRTLSALGGSAVS
jgi:hypothetical protein